MDETNIDLNAVAEAADQPETMNDKEALMANLIGMYQHIMDQCNENKINFSVLEDVASGLWTLRTGVNHYHCGNDEKD